MLTRLAILTQQLVGLLLGSMAVSAQVGTVLICVAMILLGPTDLLRHLA
jgi:hypothetical protein